MPGAIICLRCARTCESECQTTDGAYVPGHLPVTPVLVDRGLPANRLDIDLGSHLLYRGTQRAVVQSEPASGIAQGARSYLAALLADFRLNAASRARIEAAFAARPASEQPRSRAIGMAP